MRDGTVLLLGCGPVGLSAARFLGEDRIFGRVIAADLIQERAAAASEMCGPKATSASLDALDDEALARALGDVALVLNTIRLPLRTLLPFIRNVVEAGASYADCNSDTESLQAVFDSEYLESLAGYRAVSVLPGLGASPGLTNALTAYLAQRLERIDGARFYLLDDLRRRSVRQWRDRLAAFGSPALVWRDGGWREVSAMTEWGEAIFPHPVGPVSCCTVGLGPVTLPQSFASLADVSCHRGFADPLMAEIMSDLAGYGFASDEPVDTANGPLSPVEFASLFFSGPHDVWSGRVSEALRPGRHSGRESAGAAMRQAVVSGMLRGKKTDFTMTYRFPGEDDADNTAATLAVGGRMLLARELPAPGVHAPESLDPAPFLWNMERRGVEIQLTKTVED